MNNPDQSGGSYYTYDNRINKNEPFDIVFNDHLFKKNDIIEHIDGYKYLVVKVNNTKLRKFFNSLLFIIGMSIDLKKVKVKLISDK